MCVDPGVPVALSFAAGNQSLRLPALCSTFSSSFLCSFCGCSLVARSVETASDSPSNGCSGSLLVCVNGLREWNSTAYIVKFGLSSRASSKSSLLSAGFFSWKWMKCEDVSKEIERFGLCCCNDEGAFDLRLNAGGSRSGGGSPFGLRMKSSLPYLFIEGGRPSKVASNVA